MHPAYIQLVAKCSSPSICIARATGCPYGQSPYGNNTFKKRGFPDWQTTEYRAAQLVYSIRFKLSHAITLWQCQRISQNRKWTDTYPQHCQPLRSAWPKNIRFFYDFPHIVSGLRHVLTLINQNYLKQEYVNAWGVEPRYRYLFLVVEVFVVIVVVVLLL